MKAESEGEVRSADEIILHEQAFSNSNYLEHDVALIKLDEPIDDIKPVVLADLEIMNVIRVGLELSLNGWGSMDPHSTDAADILQQATAEVQNSSRCTPEHITEDVPSSMLCAGLTNKTEGACHKDHGAPLWGTAANGDRIQIAHFSWNGWNSQIGCGEDDTLDLYTQSASYRQWIERKANITLSKPTLEWGVSPGDAVCWYPPTGKKRELVASERHDLLVFPTIEESDTPLLDPIPGLDIDLEFNLIWKVGQFEFEVEEGVSELELRLYGMTGNLDLYLFEGPAPETVHEAVTGSTDFSLNMTTPYPEEIDIKNPKPGKWYAKVIGGLDGISYNWTLRIRQYK